MTNNVENKNLESRADDRVFYDVNNMEGEMMRYRTNSLSYKLGLAGILVSILGAFICLNSLSWGATVIIKILGNIVIILFGFLAVEKIKTYSKTYSYIMLGIGGISIARIFWCPLIIMNWYAKYQDYLASGDSAGVKECEEHIGPTITGSAITNSYLPQSGYFRGIAAIVLIAIAAALFISAAVIGLVRAKKYADYMQTQDTSKGV